MGTTFYQTMLLSSVLVQNEPDYSLSIAKIAEELDDGSIDVMFFAEGLPLEATLRRGDGPLTPIAEALIDYRPVYRSEFTDVQALQYLSDKHIVYIDNQLELNALLSKLIDTELDCTEFHISPLVELIAVWDSVMLSRNFSRYEAVNMAVTLKMPTVINSDTKPNLSSTCQAHFYPEAVADGTVDFNALTVMGLSGVFIVFAAMAASAIGGLGAELVVHSVTKRQPSSTVHKTPSHQVFVLYTDGSSANARTIESCLRAHGICDVSVKQIVP